MSLTDKQIEHIKSVISMSTKTLQGNTLTATGYVQGLRAFATKIERLVEEDEPYVVYKKKKELDHISEDAEIAQEEAEEGEWLEGDVYDGLGIH